MIFSFGDLFIRSFVCVIYDFIRCHSCACLLLYMCWFVCRSFVWSASSVTVTPVLSQRYSSTTSERSSRSVLYCIVFIHFYSLLSALAIQRRSWLQHWYCVEVNTLKRYRQLSVKDLPTWQLEWDLYLRPCGRKALSPTTKPQNPTNNILHSTKSTHLRIKLQIFGAEEWEKEEVSTHFR